MKNNIFVLPDPGRKEMPDLGTPSDHVAKSVLHPARPTKTGEPTSKIHHIHHENICVLDVNNHQRASTIKGHKRTK
jgi:hypothetical protein